MLPPHGGRVDPGIERAVGLDLVDVGVQRLNQGFVVALGDADRSAVAVVDDRHVADDERHGVLIGRDVLLGDQVGQQQAVDVALDQVEHQHVYIVDDVGLGIGELLLQDVDLQGAHLRADLLSRHIFNGLERVGLLFRHHHDLGGRIVRLAEIDDLLALRLGDHAGNDQVDLPGLQRRDQAGKGLIGDFDVQPQLFADAVGQRDVEAGHLLLAGLRVGIIKLIRRIADGHADDDLSLGLQVAQGVRRNGKHDGQDQHQAQQDGNQFLHNRSSILVHRSFGMHAVINEYSLHVHDYTHKFAYVKRYLQIYSFFFKIEPCNP